MKAKIKNYLEETMVLVEGGVFMMGEEFRKHKESTNDFMICKYPVIQEFYEWVIGRNPSYFKGKQRPVEQVDWYDAIEFCNGLSSIMDEEAYYKIEKDINEPDNKSLWKIGINEKSNGYRLPTEIEWEYAARGGMQWEDNFKFAGCNKLEKVGWCNENSHKETKIVGLKQSNQIGLYEMNGNVWEWCLDESNSPNLSNYREIAVKTGWKLIRGSAWDSLGSTIRIDYSGNAFPDTIAKSFGFRILKSI